MQVPPGGELSRGNIKVQPLSVTQPASSPAGILMRGDKPGEVVKITEKQKYVREAVEVCKETMVSEGDKCPGVEDI